MRVVLALVFGVALHTFVIAQDGSNISYLKLDELTEDCIGAIVQIDFYKNSMFRISSNNERGRIGDAVNLKINGKEVTFLENRSDDGYNNWFREQYLESKDGKLRIREFKLLKFGKKTISFIGYFNVSPFEQQFVIAKSDIAMILKKSSN